MSIADIVQANQALMPIAGPIISAASGLGGVLIGASLTARTERRRLKLGFVEKRLTEFYSPMLGLRKGIRAISELRVKIEQASESGWREVAGSMGDEQFEPGATEKRFAPTRSPLSMTTNSSRRSFYLNTRRWCRCFGRKCISPILIPRRISASLLNL